MNAAKARDAVLRIAPQDAGRALKMARGIGDPWCRCQALSHVALLISNPNRRSSVIDEALSAGVEAGDPNRVVTVSSWPIKVLCRCDLLEKLEGEVARLLDIIAQEPSPVRRADALNLLLGAVVEGPKSVFWDVYNNFLRACTSPLKSGKRSKKGTSLLVRWAGVITKFDTVRGSQLMDLIEGPEYLEQARKNVGMSPHATPQEIISWPNV